MIKVALALVLVVSVLCGTSVSAAGITYTDVDGRWYESMVKEAAANGLDMLTGDKFNPEQPITREQFVRMVNWAYGLTREADQVPFEDIADDDPYYADIAIAYRAKYIEGRSDTEFDPYDSLTRQEAAVILSRLLPLYGVSATGTVEQFTDYDEIADWAVEEMGQMTTAGYFEGYPDGSIKPLGTLKNSEALALLTRIIEDITIVDDDFTTKPGSSYEDTVYTGTITVPARYKVTFSNCVLLGDLVSKTTQSQTRWSLVNDTTVANVEYTEETYVPNPPQPEEPDEPDEPDEPEEPDDGDWDFGFE